MPLLIADTPCSFRAQLGGFGGSLWALTVDSFLMRICVLQLASFDSWGKQIHPEANDASASEPLTWTGSDQGPGKGPSSVLTWSCAFVACVRVKLF